MAAAAGATVLPQPLVKAEAKPEAKPQRSLVKPSTLPEFVTVELVPYNKDIARLLEQVGYNPKLRLVKVALRLRIRRLIRGLAANQWPASNIATDTFLVFPQNFGFNTEMRWSTASSARISEVYARMGQVSPLRLSYTFQQLPPPPTPSSSSSSLAQLNIGRGILNPPPVPYAQAPDLTTGSWLVPTELEEPSMAPFSSYSFGLSPLWPPQTGSPELLSPLLDMRPLSPWLYPSTSWTAVSTAATAPTQQRQAVTPIVPPPPPRQRPEPQVKLEQPHRRGSIVSAPASASRTLQALAISLPPPSQPPPLSRLTLKEEDASLTLMAKLIEQELLQDQRRESKRESLPQQSSSSSISSSISSSSSSKRRRISQQRVAESELVSSESSVQSAAPRAVPFTFVTPQNNPTSRSIMPFTFATGSEIPIPFVPSAFIVPQSSSIVSLSSLPGQGRRLSSVRAVDIDVSVPRPGEQQRATTSQRRRRLSNVRAEDVGVTVFRPDQQQRTAVSQMLDIDLFNSFGYQRQMG